MEIHFSVSEAQTEPHPQTGIPPISPHQRQELTLESEQFVQLTYNKLRTGPNGDEIAGSDERGFWQVYATNEWFTDVVVTCERES